MFFKYCVAKSGRAQSLLAKMWVREQLSAQRLHECLVSISHWLIMQEFCASWEFCLCDPGSALSEDLLKRAALPVLDDPE